MLKPYLTASLVSSTIISGIVLSSYLVSADDIIDQININVPISCSMSGTGTTSHNSNVYNGIYTSDIGTTTIDVFCNDGEGFSIYAIGFTGDQYSGDDHTKLIGASTNEKIVTGTATATGNPDVSNWAMKLSTTTSPTPAYPITIVNSFNNYHIVPDTYTKVATRTSATDVGNNATGSELTTTYAAYISKTQSADTYTGKVKYTLVHPNTEIPLQPQVATSGCINYFPNGSNVEGAMGCQSISASDTTATLLASNFSRSGYGFAGWSDAFDYATNANAHFYGPNEDITFTAGQYTGTNNGLALYAVWVKSAGSLQDASKVATLCGTGTGSLTTAPTDGTANLSSVSALTDQRDNQTYAIAKLADGKCWMIENLRLEADNTRTAEKQALAQGYGASATYGNFGGLANAESANFDNVTTANSLYYSGTQSGDATIDIGTTGSPGYRMPRYNNINTSTRASLPTSNGEAMYSYGNYYTWHAAIADLSYNGTNNQSTTSTSLCPAGWHLPTGGAAYASGSTSGVNVTGDTNTFREFYNLGYKTMDEIKTAYEDTPNSGNAYYSSNTTNTAGKTATAAISSFPNNFLYSGYLRTSSARYRGSHGCYWSSTAYLSSYSHTLYLNSSTVRPGTNSSNKSYGYSIRCTASAGS